MLRLLPEWWMYFAVGLGVVVWTRHRYVGGHRFATAVASLVVVGMATSQVIRDPRLTYPLHTWVMYGDRVAPLTYVEFVALDADGATSELPFAAAGFWSTGPFSGYSALSPAMARVTELRTRCRCAGGDVVVDGILRTIAELQFACTGRRIEKVEIVEVRVATTQQAASRTRLYTWTNAP